ncbi:MAG: methyltransferase domain-containing protein, partial [bacterium]|nr:methyltransferase domain-containing protein [bacterium]
EFIDGREIEVSVMGNDKIMVSRPGELIPHNEFYDYNDKYIEVDPDYVRDRPLGKASMVGKLLGADNVDLKILDYGGGTGLFAETLRNSGFKHTDTYDPFSAEFKELPRNKYDLVTCFEVFEHVNDPFMTLQTICDVMSESGGLLFSTRIQPEIMDRGELDWWYAGPRNGHISLHTRRSLRILLEKAGLKFVSLNDNLHFGFRKFPEFAGEFGCVA